MEWLNKIFNGKQNDGVQLHCKDALISRRSSVSQPCAGTSSSGKMFTAYLIIYKVQCYYCMSWTLILVNIIKSSIITLKQKEETSASGIFVSIFVSNLPDVHVEIKLIIDNS